MILRKPYALFIKIFKPIHIFMSALVVFLIYKTNILLSFFNQYMYSNNSVVGQSLKESLVSNSLFVIPIVLIVFSLIFLGIMFIKKKPITFYVVSIFVFLVVIVLTLYTTNFLNTMEEIIVSIKLVKLHHDLTLINMIIEILILTVLIIRGLGINFKKFNFDSDVTKFDISDSDKEEFELSINIDLDSAKRRRRKKIRQIKYIYKENKIPIIIAGCIMFVAGVLITIFAVFGIDNSSKEGIVFNMNNFNLVVNKTLLLKENYTGEKLTENNLVVIDLSLQSNFSSISLFIKDFGLEIGDAVFPVETKYNDSLLDLGNSYENNILTQDYNKYILVFEIPDKYITSDMFLTINNEGVKTGIKLNPQIFSGDESINIKEIGENLSFEDSLGNISFKINTFDIKNEFLIKYKYCVEDECIISKEYIQPSINENFDKTILKLDIEFIDDSQLEINNFFDFFSRFGAIYYKKGDSWISQSNNFERIESKKVNNKNNVYIGVNANIEGAESLKLVFNIRNSSYEYILK